MRKFLAICILCSLASCNFFESADTKTQKLVNKELQSIDWTAIDHYPLFNNCDENASKAQQKKCFIETLSFHFKMGLQDFQPVIKEAIQDSIFIDFIVEQTGDIAITNISNEEVFKEEAQEFNNKITNSLNSLPRIEPALKRGIPVKTKFRIPIVLNSN